MRAGHYTFDSYVNATFRNQENWRRKTAEAGGVLDKQVLVAALGKCRPKKRMSGLSGTVTIGISLEISSDQLLSVITYYECRVPYYECRVP